MTDRFKEIIFNILGDTVSGTRVLDLFAGSGSMGLEALSRGAREVTFVESGIWALRCIRRNLKDLDVERRASILPIGVFGALRKLERMKESFSIIFLDPPYNKELVKKVLKQLDQSDILFGPTQVIVHHSRQEKLPEALERLNLLREERVGQACLSFLSGKEE